MRSRLAPTYEAQFDQIWSEYDRVYPAFGYKKVTQANWNDLKAEYRPRAAAARTEDQFIAIVKEMFEPLRDVHVWFVDPKGTIVPTYVPWALENFDRDRWVRALRNASYIPHGNAWGEGTVGGFAYIYIATWGVNQIDSLALDAALLRYRDAPGMIIDVRTNAGGSDAAAFAFASRFVTKPYVVSYVQVRNGAKHDDLGPEQARTIAPRGPWQYTKPVIVLAGRGGFSANESFVAAMRVLPHATVIGDTTGGASGNPKTIKMGNGWSFSVPRWIEFGPDKQPIEWKGVPPSVAVPWAPGTFSIDGDPLIDTAVGMLGEMNGLYRAASPDKIKN
ncbi:MAG: S41 family peptidase [Gemmatimonas sp.]